MDASCLSEGEHPVSAKFRALRNRFVRWWVLRAPHEQPIFTSVFEKNLIFPGANRVIAFQLRFSYVSAQLRFLLLFGCLFLVPKYPRSSKSNFSSNIFLCFNCVSAVAKTGCSTHPLACVVLFLFNFFSCIFLLFSQENISNYSQEKFSCQLFCVHW